MATRRKAQAEVPEEPNQPPQVSAKRTKTTKSTNIFIEIIRYSVIALIGGMFLSRMLTDRWIPYEGKWVRYKTYFPPKKHWYSETQLSKYDGSNPSLPILLAIDGDVYDVSSNPKSYGKGGSYGHFSGTDHARAYGTGCFKSDGTHDLRGLTEKQLDGVLHWKKFFREHKDYAHVGWVSHPPIDPNSPEPPVCDPKKG